MGCSGLRILAGRMGAVLLRSPPSLKYQSTSPGGRASSNNLTGTAAGWPVPHCNASLFPWFGPLAAQTRFAILRIRAVSQLSLGSGIGELNWNCSRWAGSFYNKHYTVSRANGRPGIFRRCVSRPLHSGPGCTTSAIKGAAR